MMRSMGFAGLAMVLVASGCTTATAPDRAGGVGFGDYGAYLAQREAALQGSGPIPEAMSPPARPAPRIALPFATARPAAATAAPATGEPLNVMGTAVMAPTGATATITTAPLAPTGPVDLTAGLPLPTAPGSAGISDENNFDAVASRETIASDKARIEANRAAYQQVAPTALPERAADTGPNLAAYALAATNRLGEAVFRRSPIKLANHDRACGHFASADLAQTAFLLNGGPKRDPGNLDPDGDGFACSWDPTPFQSVRQ